MLLTKPLAEHERAAALTAIATAKRAHPSVGIRPATAKRTRRTAGIHAGMEPDRAIERARHTWPRSKNWEVFGASSFQASDDNAAAWAVEDTDGTLAAGDGCFAEPTPYGAFTADPLLDSAPSAAIYTGPAQAGGDDC